MPSAEIITIGTEILLGEIVDTNAVTLALALREAGIDIYRKTTVGDNAGRIAQAIREALARADIIITTGGLGPTIDDPTRSAVAEAFGVESEFRPELWDQIVARFALYGRVPNENNRRQAFVPKGALAVYNPVGTAPAFICEQQGQVVICLPGVPAEMEHLLHGSVLPYLLEHYPIPSIIQTRLLHTVGIGESIIDEHIGDLEKLSNPTVGLAAHAGQVDIRLTAKASNKAEAMMMIDRLEIDLRTRLKEWIYGADDETLEVVVAGLLEKSGLHIAILEGGLDGQLIQSLSAAKGQYLGGRSIDVTPTLDELVTHVLQYRQKQAAEIVLGIVLQRMEDHAEILQVLVSPDGEQRLTRKHGGPPEYATRWAVNYSLDMIRRFIIQRKGQDQEKP